MKFLVCCAQTHENYYRAAKQSGTVFIVVKDFTARI